MNKDNVVEMLKKILTKTMELPADTQIQGEDLITELGINSVDALEILVWIENTFEIQIPDEDLDSSLLRSIYDLASYILKQKNL